LRRHGRFWWTSTFCEIDNALLAVVRQAASTALPRAPDAEGLGLGAGIDNALLAVV